MPAFGFPIDLLAEILNVDRAAILDLVQDDSGLGSLLVVRADMIRLGHDRVQQVAYRMMDEEEAGILHSTIANFLIRSNQHEDYVFEAADHVAQALSFGTFSGPKEDIVRLFLDAASKSALSASFHGAMRYLDMAECEW